MERTTALIDQVLRRIPNKYVAVTVASRRAKAINDGLGQLVRTGAMKPGTVALTQIAAEETTYTEAVTEIEAPEEDEKELLPSPDLSVAEEE